ncbi:MAG: hypothetical protein AB7N65_03440 [Vicinamibacterales bacterium]
MHDGIDLKQAVIHNSPTDVHQWPIGLELQGVEFKAGTASDANCGVRPIFDRQAMNARWPDVRVWTHDPVTGRPNAPTDGWIQYTIWAFVRTGPVWRGAALHEFWSDRFGKPRVWTGAPILTQWSDWVYRNQWGAEMQAYQPKAGDEIAFMLTAGDRRSPHNLGDVRERTNVVRVRLAAAGIPDLLGGDEAVAPPPQPPQPPESTTPATPTHVTGTTAAMDELKAALQRVEEAVRGQDALLRRLDERLTAMEARSTDDSGQAAQAQQVAEHAQAIAEIRQQLDAVKNSIPTSATINLFGRDVRVPLT